MAQKHKVFLANFSDQKSEQKILAKTCMGQWKKFVGGLLLMWVFIFALNCESIGQLLINEIMGALTEPVYISGMGH